LPEYPPRPLIKTPDLPNIPSLFGMTELIAGNLVTTESAQPIAATPLPDERPLGLPLIQAEFLQSVVAAPGQALVVMDPDLLPQAWLDTE